MNNEELNTFDKLVKWATWQIIEGITTGQKLRTVVNGIVQYTIQWAKEQEEIKKKNGL